MQRLSVCVLMCLGVSASYAADSQDNSRRLNQHKVTSRRSPAPEPGAENETIPSLVEGLRTPKDWYAKKRPELVALWTQILGKLGPAPADRKWFGDIRRARTISKQDFDRYT